jgi:anti-sigma-K factor RskA
VEHVDELIAGQALYALSAEDSERVALHVAECERCRVQLREAEALAASLAYAVAPAAPPPDLRARLLAAVEPVVAAPPPVEPVVAAAPATAPRREKPARTGWWPRFSTFAVPVLAVAVTGLVLWNVSLRGDLNSLTRNLQHAQAVPLGNVGTVVTGSGGGATIYARIARAPAGKTYEAWVIHGKAAVPAGLFQGGGTLTLKLTAPAEPGDVIAITIEPAGGSKVPTTPPFVHSTV